MPGICPRCSRNVYFAEEKLALGKVWHYLCFSCRNCRKLLNSWSITTYNDDLYCQKCCPKPKSIQAKIQKPEINKSLCHLCTTSHYVKTDMWISKSDGEDDEDAEQASACDPILLPSRSSMLSQSESLIDFHNSLESQELDLSSEDQTLQSEKHNEDDVLSGSPKKLISFYKLPAPFHCENDDPENSSNSPMNHTTFRRVSFKIDESPEAMENPSADGCEKKSVEEFTLMREDRLRGGSGCCCTVDSKSPESNVKHECYSRSPNSCMQQPQSYRIHRCNEELIRCGATSPECSNGGCCGESCGGSCRKPGQICVPIKPCTSLLRSCRKVPSYPPMVPEIPRCYRHRNRCKNPSMTTARHQPCIDDLNCSNGWKGSSVGCECFGGGLDCQRCGRKVYQAEMQIASGVPYHNICFSCYCCRKPLETLTYHESCGEIYCKQCYIRNFGPQGYGYSGVLQTPM